MINAVVNDIIYRNIEQVFATIVSKEKIIKYFVSYASSNLIAGTTVHWEWSDCNANAEVEVVEIKKNNTIVFTWKGNKIKTKVTISLEAVTNQTTKIKIVESSYPTTPEGIQKVMQQTQGWTDFSCSLKAYLYTGINLRTGKSNT